MAEKEKKSMFGMHEGKGEMHEATEHEEKEKHESEEPAMSEHRMALGDDHPQTETSGEPMHPKLKALMAMLHQPEEDEAPPMRGGFLGMKKKAS